MEKQKQFGVSEIDSELWKKHRVCGGDKFPERKTLPFFSACFTKSAHV
jgi:hypothetical protein